jgi:hypothetical protein
MIPENFLAGGREPPLPSAHVAQRRISALSLGPLLIVLAVDSASNAKNYSTTK